MSRDIDDASRATLGQEEGEAPWSMLRAHGERGALLFVDPSLDLLEVAGAVAEDRTEVVAAWMAADLLSRPTAAQMATDDDDTRQWTFVIVQPFVFVRGPQGS